MGGGFGGDFEDDAVVKLRGLPYDATQMQVQEFFIGEVTTVDISTFILQERIRSEFYHLGWLFKL